MARPISRPPPSIAAGANSNPPPQPHPALFIAVASDDSQSEQARLTFSGAGSKPKAPAELHVFQTGRHGFRAKRRRRRSLLDRLEEWLKLTAG